MKQDCESGAALEALRDAFIAGEKSEEPRVIDPAAILKRMRMAHQANHSLRNV